MMRLRLTKPDCAFLLSGLVIPLLTYMVARSASIGFAVFLVAAVAAVFTIFGTIVADGPASDIRTWRACLLHCLGALITESTIFTHYYLTYGYQDQKLNVGIGIAVIEFLTIALVGSAAIASYLGFIRRVERKRDNRIS